METSDLELTEQLAALKAQAYLDHVYTIIENHCERIPSGPFAGEYVLHREQRELITYMLGDVNRELMKVAAFHQAKAMEVQP